MTTAALLFIRHVEDQVTLGTVGEALFSQWLIYPRRGFIRLLGVTLSGQPEGQDLSWSGCSWKQAVSTFIS